MRLVCPNCGAQYEVDDRVMPEGGRDVQCSNCGHAWFQMPPQSASSPVEEDDQDGFGTDVPVKDPPAESAPEVTPIDNSDADLDGDFEPPQNARRALDDNVRDILQEEAERELSAREGEQEQLETQPDLGLDDAGDQDRSGLQARMARLRGYEDTFEQGAPAQEMKGRDVLPDIEEINSTLDAPAQDSESSMPDQGGDGTSKRGGFRRGFTLILLLAIIALALYILAPRLADAVPALKPTLDQYISLIDGLRAKLDDLMRGAVTSMQGAMEKPEG